jgi:glycosyltransferase involved in cell wall biosynthesis
MMISAIICTHNRAERLSQGLRKFSKSQYQSETGTPELIIVDNNSQDDTRHIVEQFAATSNFTVRYVFEGQQGLAHARNRGIQEAKHPIIAFTDDDCLIDPNWLRSIQSEFGNDPRLSIIGGRVESADLEDQPVGLRTFRDRAQIRSAEQLLSRMIGCNFACSRGVFDEIGFFDPALGKGTRIESAEDTDFFYRAFTRDLKIAYSPEILVHHAHGRKTLRSCQRVRDEYAKGRGAFYCKYILGSDRQIMKLAYCEVHGLLQDFATSLPASGPQRNAIRLLCHLALGAAYQLLEIRRMTKGRRLQPEISELS